MKNKTRQPTRFIPNNSLFSKIRLFNLLAILFLSSLYFIALFFFNQFFSPTYFYVGSLFLLAFLICFAANLVPNYNAGFLFLFFSALLTWNINDIGVTGIFKVLIFLIIGVIFELSSNLFAIKIYTHYLTNLLSAILVITLIPVLIALFLSLNVALAMLTSFINLLLLTFLAGASGAVVSIAVWILFGSYLEKIRPF